MTTRTDTDGSRRTLAAEGPNAQQIEYWNDVSGPKWIALEERIEAQISPIGERALEAATPAAGEHVLDVGCGCGQTSLALGERVGAAGGVLGVDVSAVMLERARERARAAGVRHVRFANADAQTHVFGDERFDLAFSRFGVMFFADPAAAFANLAGALRPGGRLAFVCWQELRRNPWMLTPLLALAELIELPPAPEPGAPGPFSLADAGRLRDLLARGGFRDVRCDALEDELEVGGGADLDAVVDFLLQLGPAGAALREAPPEVLPRAQRAVRDSLAPHATPEGVCLPYAAWLVTARV